MKGRPDPTGKDGWFQERSERVFDVLFDRTLQAATPTASPDAAAIDAPHAGFRDALGALNGSFAAAAWATCATSWRRASSCADSPTTTR
jgi:hypothetical protein